MYAMFLLAYYSYINATSVSALYSYRYAAFFCGVQDEKTRKQGGSVLKVHDDDADAVFSPAHPKKQKKISRECESLEIK